MPISDTFRAFQPGLNSPVEGGFEVTPADGVDLQSVTRAVMVAGAGDLAVTLKSGDTITLPGLTPGMIYPIRVAQVAATGTTATGIKGLL
ncbi:hypothetical protein [uncultured Tateyamaria sp.]|uniref:spike base protein, RCAP_Rcc01079 family n=1 Tax=uncultured Tateyamaria sp. TaxID=455651 RepID=UPI00260A3AA0|nr:hypothetical protein [uncultured Tateyamaria sp.]